MEDDKIAVPGFLAGGISVGIKLNGQPDLGLIYSITPAAADGVFTVNSFRAAPVQISQERLRHGMAQAIIINSGNANACTGAKGMDDALAMANSLARELKIEEKLVLVASTGVIGHPLPVDKILGGLKRLVHDLTPGGIVRAEKAIMTTDRWPKMVLRKVTIGGKEVTFCGMAKGAGMIQPHMATMLAFILTDLAIGQDELRRAFRYAVDRTFNAISVDGCMSTNDTVVVMANGLAQNRPPKVHSRDFYRVRETLMGLMEELAKEIVRDGEGATKVLKIEIEGAASLKEAKQLAYAVGNANLVKAAFFGQDPNWGRIISAVGSLGLPLDGEKVELYLEEACIFSRGVGQAWDGEYLKAVMAAPEISITVKLGRGKGAWRLFASDLTFDYVKINSHYRT
ncbi:MAG TPA: bifunctional glutamate N-acetyltransferase/amino-acid acetyltransferase ArgJ [Syntrophales bacterium]|nr:bifunctional glutamate N-acetyltransferase/amino-acid acetyltransferase ArgJ [Syntrophales bacterium]HOL59097.1 bifunctional glutamate N-acetyltransferase/amino-acid acetyltransferase ArgJ [Syntrophales bacterium]HPO35394.1 bifunctional glutamate N-acetyltransferase/amino-acid acetyltransferase ArgJ [Syntrophales bacterium]